MKVSKADVPTANAASYLRQLCRHWAHKFPVQFNDEHGRIELSSAICTLDATPATLAVLIEIRDSEDQSRIEKVVAEHLQRFGLRELLVFDWRRR